MVERGVVKVHLSVHVHSRNVEREVVPRGVILVRQRAQLTRLPLEHGLLVIGGATNDGRAEMIIQHLHRGDLHIRAHVVAEGQRGDRIHAILLVQVGSRGNGILRLSLIHI